MPAAPTISACENGQRHMITSKAAGEAITALRRKVCNPIRKELHCRWFDRRRQGLFRSYGDGGGHRRETENPATAALRQC